MHTPTPRTDAFEPHGYEDCDIYDSWRDFARELERESAAKDALITRLRDAVSGFRLKGQPLAGSHPHLARYWAFPDDVWSEARAAVAATPESAASGLLAELINLRQTVGNHECALKAMDAVNTQLREDKERLDWLDRRDRITWNTKESDPMDMRLRPLRELIDQDRKENP